MGSQLDNQLGLLFRLVDRVLATAQVEGAARDGCENQLRSYATKVLGSQLSHAPPADESAVLQGMRLDLEAQGRGDLMTKVLERCEKLARNSRVSTHTRVGVMQLLRQVAKDGGLSGSGGSGGISLVSLGRAIHPVASTRQDTAARPTSSQQQQLYSVSLPPSSTASRMASLNGSQAMYGADDGALDTNVRRDRSGSAGSDDTYSFTVKEPLLVRDVLYACQGINGKFTTFGDAEQRFVINPQADVPTADREQMCALMELGFLFKRVQSHLSAARAEHGAIRQALCAALGQENKDFYRFMAVLQGQATQPIPSPGDSGADAVGPYLTLRRLEVWLAEPIRRMRLMAVLADTTAGLSGGALAGAVYTHVHGHGDPFVRSYTSRMLDAVCVPLFEMIRRWVFEGQLEDPYGEFFVVKQAGAAGDASLDMWRDGYAIDAAHVPRFLSPQLASKILRAGKSVNFLQECCGDVSWVQERAMSAHAAAAAAVSIGQVEGLEKFVSDALADVDRRLISLLFDKFALAKHCDAMRRYVLLGQGDFVQALMDMAQAELGQEASAVSEISLNHIVRQAISASNAKYDDEDVIDRVRARKHKSVGGGEVGWDVFRLTYDVRGPLATLFTPSAQRAYHRVFTLLWRLKRAEADLAHSWVMLKCEVERTCAKFNKGAHGGADGALEIARRFLTLRSEMSHFCTNLQYYIMYEVMETAWREFNAQATAASDLDELIAAHDKYLDTLVTKALLGEATETLRVTLRELLENMLTLRGQVRKFSDTVRASYSKLFAARARIDSRTAAGQWGTAAGDEQIRAISASELEPLLVGVEELDRKHRKGIADFTHRLPSQAHEEVRFLLYRLDFTEFYKRSSGVADDGDEDDEDGVGGGLGGTSARATPREDGMVLG
ncbi:hypothetical protein FOA52_006146 [Chlamydomonas sp. UWO 241]|nr:hypothetical protein FOA52_006146 [Chlamydomonas sp. UWO 241]